MNQDTLREEWNRWLSKPAPTGSDILREPRDEFEWWLSKFDQREQEIKNHILKYSARIPKEILSDLISKMGNKEK